jgi:two-component system LytT family response regulator
MKLKAIIIDDEPFVRDDLRHMLASHKEIEVAAEAGTIAGAKQKLAAGSFQVVFLDIQLRGGTGFDLVPFIDPSTDIIFITAHDEFAVRAFEVNALDYLLKPVTAGRLAESLARLKPNSMPEQAGLAKPAGFKSGDSVLIRTDSGRLFVRLDEIAAITAIGGNYAAIYLESGQKLLSRKTLKEWETMLPASLFARIHRASIINTGFLERVAYAKDGSCEVHLAGQRQTFGVSRRMVSSLKNMLEDRTP